MRSLILLISCLYFLHELTPLAAAIRSENITVTRGETVKFRCQLPLDFSPKESIVQWKKWRSPDDETIISINGRVPKIFERSYRTQLTNQFSSLELSQVNNNDSTTYICQTFETQTVLCQYNLVVLIKPEAPSLTINKVDIEEHQAVTLTCSSLHGNPPPQYTWSRNGTLLTSLGEQVRTTGDSSTYTLNVTRSDNQMKYECQIWNQALASPLRLEQYLHVKYRPYVNILEGNQIRTIVGIESHSQNFTCHFDANPPPTAIYWITNQTTIVSRERTLHIPRLTAEQSGIYTCIVENTLGRANHSVHLDVQYSPRVRAREQRLVVNRSDAVDLRCLSDSNPPPHQVVWLKNNSEVFRQNHLADLRIEKLERYHAGIYTCMVYNRFHNNQTSSGSSTMELVVQSRPIIETTYAKVAAEVGQALTLTCRVIGQPKPTIVWKMGEETIECNEIVNETCYLRFAPVAKTDFGAYRCVAENFLGKEEWTYTIVSRGKPETPTDILVSDITASSFKVQFSPSFDGGSGSQRFAIEVTDAANTTTSIESVPFNIHEHTIKGLNESTLYFFRIKSTNVYGESPWSNTIPVQTNELILTSDDLPQLHVVLYNSKEGSLQFGYLPESSRLSGLNDEQLCLNIRQSPDGRIFHPVPKCLPIVNQRVNWKMAREFSYLKLSVCSKKDRTICGQEIEMKDGNNQDVAPMVIGIVLMTGFLVLVIVIIAIICCRARKRRMKSGMESFGIVGLDKDIRPVISDPHLQNPYLLYSNVNSHTPSYDYDYHQRQIASSFTDPDQLKIVHVSPQWVRSDSRSGSNPSSESSCLTQNTNVLVVSNPDAQLVSHYGFPPIMSPAMPQSSIIQSSSSSGNSTPNRIKKLFYEVVV